MDSSFSFENLSIYQKALSFSIQVYAITNKWPREHIFGLSDQFKRAALSISLNIAEGYSRSQKDFKHFLRISRGSCFECIPIISIALSLHLITKEEHTMIYNSLIELSKMISSFQSKLN